MWNAFLAAICDEIALHSQMGCPLHAVASFAEELVTSGRYPIAVDSHATLLTDSGRMNIKRSEYATDDGPIDPDCPCSTCQRHSRGYLRHLATLREPVAATLCTVHNLTWILTFVGRIRSAIAEGTLDQLRAATAEVWSGSGPGLNP